MARPLRTARAGMGKDIAGMVDWVAVSVIVAIVVQLVGWAWMASKQSTRLDLLIEQNNEIKIDVKANVTAIGGLTTQVAVLERVTRANGVKRAS